MQSYNVISSEARVIYFTLVELTPGPETPEVPLRLQAE